MSPSRGARLSLSLVAILFLSLPSVLAAAPIRVTGRVQSEKAGLSGVRVELFPAYEGYAEAVRRLMEKTPPAPLAKARTDAEGDFEILVPESGCYRLEVRTEGYLAEEFPLVPLVEDIELPPTMLMRASPVEVRAVGPEGRPLAGIEVRNLDASPWSWRGREGQLRTWRLIPPRAITDREGRASLPWFKMYGPPTVEALSPRFLGQKATGKPEEAITLRLVPSRSGWIEARGADGQPVPGALARWNGRPVGITGADGRLEIAVPEGEPTLTLETREGWGARVARTEGRGILPVRLAPPRRTSGRVVDSSSRKPVAGAVAWSGFPLVAPPVRTDAEGTFSLDVPTEEGWLEAGAAGFLPGERQLAKKGAQPTVLSLSPAVPLSGTVVDKSGRPVAGVRITLGYMVGRQGVQAMARSRGDGGFRFPQLPPGGTFKLTAVRTGFARTEATARTAPAGQPSPPARIVMEDGQTAFGRVVDPGGRPLAGAAVRLTTGSQSPVETASDEEGRFEFRHLSPGRIFVLATHPDYAPAFLNRTEIPSGQPAFDLGTLRLPPAEAIEGRVTDSRGTPVEGAAVRVNPGEGRNPWMFWESEEPEPLRTAPDGTFRAGNLEGGQRFNIRVDHPGYVASSLPGVEAPTQQPLQIELKAARSLSGRVTDPEGEPVADASLDWFQARGGGFSSQSLGTSDADGRFRVTGFPPGMLSLTVSAEGYVPRRIEGLQIPGDRDPEELQITLERAITLEVRVLNAEGEPVPNISVFAEPVETKTEEQEDRLLLFSQFNRHGPNRTDVAGRCRLTVPKPGSYWVSASRQGPPARTQVTARAGSNAVEIRLPQGAEVSGRVVDEKGAAKPGATILLRQAEELQQNKWSGADGTFTFPELPDGDYRLTAVHEGLTSEEILVTVAGRPVQGLELRLDRQRPGAALTGRILGLPPEEISSVMVRAYRQGMSEGSRVKPDGVYRFENLAPGEWRVQAQVFDGRSARDTVEIPTGGPAVELDLEFGGLTLTGRVLVDGTPLSGAEIRIHDKEIFRSGMNTAYDGTFRLRNLSAGPMTLVISGPQGLGGVRTLNVTESQDVKIDLVTGRLTGAVVSATGEPVEDALVRLQAWLPDLKISFGESVARTGADGTFEAPRLGAGTYKIKVSKEGFAPAEAMATVPSGGSSAPVAVVLKPQEGTP